MSAWSRPSPAVNDPNDTIPAELLRGRVNGLVGIQVFSPAAALRRRGLFLLAIHTSGTAVAAAITRVPISFAVILCASALLRE